jgi:GLPGLI family protein
MVTREISAEMMQMGRAMGFMGGGAADAVAGAYTNLGDESYVEVREFLGRTFRIPGERPAIAWKLTGEAASFLGYPVYQAIATQDSTTIEAWFTPEIPVPAGPAQYGGLPGLILTLAVDSNRVVYTAKAVDLTTAVESIKAPSEGSKVTRAEYDKIVAEKQEELSRSRRGRRNQ